MSRHVIIPDTQIRPGVPTRHVQWAGRAIVEYRPDVVVVLGDWWDMGSLSTHAGPGSEEMLGREYVHDVHAGNQAFREMMAPVQSAMRRNRQWKPKMHYLFGNHENRITRTVAADPRLKGALSLTHLETPGFRRHGFLEIVEVDGIAYSHYFGNIHSGRPIGGSIPNRLNKIGRSFVQGHEQGFAYGTVAYPGGLRRHGLVCGSFYQHDEEYRGPQGRDEWRGIVVLNEVHRGDYCLMPLTIDYLERKFG